MVTPVNLFLLYNNSSLPNWALFLINVLGFAIGLKIAYFIIKTIIFQITKKTKTKFDDELIKIIEYPLLLSLTIIFLVSALSLFSISENIMKYIYILEKVLLLVIITWFLYSLIGLFYNYALIPIAKRSKNNLDDQIFPIVRKILRVILIIFAIMYFFDIIGISITPLLAGVGIGGIAIAFAAQKVLSDIFGGISILADEAYFINDRVKIGDVVGDVIDIGLRSTKIKTFDNTIITIPNNHVADSNIENFSRDNKKIVVRTTIGITYDTPVEKIEEAKKIIRDAIKSCKYVIDEPKVWFNAFNASSLDIYISYPIDEYSNKFAALDEINTKIKKEFDKHKIEFAYPTQTIYLKK